MIGKLVMVGAMACIAPVKQLGLKHDGIVTELPLVVLPWSMIGHNKDIAY